MIRRALLLVCLPVLVLGLVAVPLGLLIGPYQWLCFGIAIGLTVPAGLITLLATEWFSNRSPYGGLISLVLGTTVRLLFGFGGGVLVFFVAGATFRTDPVSFWVWLLGAYLLTLTLEVFLLVRK